LIFIFVKTLVGILPFQKSEYYFFVIPAQHVLSTVEGAGIQRISEKGRFATLLTSYEKVALFIRNVNRLPFCEANKTKKEWKMVEKTNLTSKLAVSLFLMIFAAAALPAGTIYVNDDANGLNDGSSWQNAFKFLQDALIVAASGDEIRAAQGIYTPDKGAGITPGDRAVSFQLVNGVTLNGGYAGAGYPDPNTRDIELYETILSGDLNGDDGPDFLNNIENSYHVVVGSGTNQTAVLDGFIITSGNANGSYDAKNNLGGGMFNHSGNPTIIHCVFRTNSAQSAGAGMCNIASSPAMRYCSFVENSAVGFYAGSGGAMFNRDNSNPTLVGCTFERNYAYDEGGGMYNWQSSPTLTNGVFTQNSTRLWGGGMFNWESNPTLTNCTFAGNLAHDEGGVMLNGKSNPTLINCTFASNRALERCGGISNGFGCEPTLTNCILWGNIDIDGMAESSQINTGATINYSCIHGWTGSLGGTGNHGNDPIFVVPAHWDDRGTPYDPSDDIWMTGDYRLLSTSPCADAGDNISVPPDTFDIDGDGDMSEPIPLDLNGKERFVDDPRRLDTGNGSPPVVDMGAYEGPNQGFLLGAGSVTVPEARTATFTLALAMDPLTTVDVMVAIESGDPDITLQSEGTLTFNSSNFSIPQTIVLTAAQDGDNLSGSAVIRITSARFPGGKVSVYEEDDERVTDILFVDVNASGQNNGSNWANAYTDLQNALSIARANSNVLEIRVAQGIYRPTEPNGKRCISFLLVNGVTLKGGYAGCTESNPDARDIKAYQTILSGDLNSNDGQNFENYSDNSFHVLRAIGTDQTTILDGFTITAGNANDSAEGNYSGGGIYKCSGNIKIAHCAFVRNSAAGSGGGVYNNGSIALNNCRFIANSAAGGGGIDNHNMSWEDTTSLTNCLFADNSASDCGGAIVTPCASIECINCTFAGNFAGGKGFYRGGGICGDDDTYMTLTNCIFWANSDIEGTSQQAQIDHDSFPQTHVNFCCVQGWTGDLGGIGNTGADPCFAKPGYQDPNGTPADANDDFWVDGDYHLKSQAGRWVPSSASWVKDDVTSLCIDAGDPASPICLEPFPNGGIINIGAYGGTREASKSYFGKPPCETPVAGDINGDCIVDFKDFAFMAYHWLEEY
jgi:hypothetical protein